MKRAIVTPATLAPVALSELKDWLGITTGGDDVQLTALLRTALDACEDFTGLMPLQQVCEEILPVANGWLTLAARPVQAITLVEGVPAEGERFVLQSGDYEIELDHDGAGKVRVANPGSAGRIAVRFTAGLAAAWTGLPEPLRHGALRLAANQYRTREDDMSSAAMPPAAVAALWRPWRRLRLT